MFLLLTQRGREEESKQIHDFLQSNLNTGHGNSLYISGLPGSGKTLTLKQTLTSVLSLYPSIKFQTIFLNCASLSTPALLYPALLDSLNIITTTTSKNNKETLRDHFTKREEPLILILDELDYLTSRDQAILYQIFSWPRLPNSRVTVIGIANAVDLPQRLLPWLRASQCIPTILPFAPYTASQLVDIVTQRLGDEGADDSVFGTGPLMLITKRVAAASGDARRCLDICRMALLKSKQQYEQEGILKESAKRFCSMKAVASVLQEAGGASSAVHAIQGLPMTQQIVLCVIANKCCISSTCINSTSKIKGIVSKVSNASGMVLNLGQAYSYYGRWCSRAKVDAVPWGDFVEIVGVLRHHHLLDVNEGGSPKRRNGKGVTKQKGKRGQRNGVQGKNASNAMKMKGWIVGIKCALEDIQKGCESKKLLRVLVGSETGKAK